MKHHPTVPGPRLKVTCNLGTTPNNDNGLPILSTKSSEAPFLRCRLHCCRYREISSLSLSYLYPSPCAPRILDSTSSGDCLGVIVLDRASSINPRKEDDAPDRSQNLVGVSWKLLSPQKLRHHQLSPWLCLAAVNLSHWSSPCGFTVQTLLKVAFTDCSVSCQGSALGSSARC